MYGCNIIQQLAGNEVIYMHCKKKPNMHWKMMKYDKIYTNKILKYYKFNFFRMNRIDVYLKFNLFIKIQV